MKNYKIFYGSKIIKENSKVSRDYILGILEALLLMKFNTDSITIIEDGKKYSYKDFLNIPKVKEKKTFYVEQDIKGTIWWRGYYEVTGIESEEEAQKAIKENSKNVRLYDSEYLCDTYEMMSEKQNFAMLECDKLMKNIEVKEYENIVYYAVKDFVD